MNIPELKLPRVVIIGGGFGGIECAKALDSNYFQIVLLDRNNYHNFQPLMYQVATAGLEPDSIAYPLRKIFKGKRNFHFRMTEVVSIDPQTKSIQTSIGALRYDYLVVATGATSTFFGMADVERFARPMKNLTEAIDLRSLILDHFERASSSPDKKDQADLMNFVIVGGGPTGVELAGALAELKQHVLPQDFPDLDIARMQIHLIEAAPRILAAMSEHASAKALQALRKRGVEVWLSTHLAKYDGKTAWTDKQSFATSALIWAAGVRGAPVAGLSSCETKSGRLMTDARLRVQGVEQVYAIGDVAQVSTLDRGHPMLGAVAMQQGRYLGQSLSRQARGGEVKPFQYRDKGTMATIGRNFAVVDLSFLRFSGMVAWFAWMLVHLLLLVGFRSRLVVLINWAWSYFQYDKGTRIIVRKPPS